MKLCKDFKIILKKIKNIKNNQMNSLKRISTK